MTCRERAKEDTVRTAEKMVRPRLWAFVESVRSWLRIVSSTFNQGPLPVHNIELLWTYVLKQSCYLNIW